MTTLNHLKRPEELTRNLHALTEEKHENPQDNPSPDRDSTRAPLKHKPRALLLHQPVLSTHYRKDMQQQACRSAKTASSSHVSDCIAWISNKSPTADLLSCDMRRRRYFIDVSEERNASIFRVEQLTKLEVRTASCAQRKRN
jgi:hypothetical protein